MSWFAITLLAYFLLALEVVLDKLLLSSKRISHPAIYAFYVGVTGLFSLIFIPFGFHTVGFWEMIYRFGAGFIFIYAMLALFFAINKSEASRVTPVVGAVVPVTIFFLSLVFLREHLEIRELAGLIVLVLGGLWISYDFSSNRKKRLFHGFYWSILAGVLLAVSAVLLKGFYQHDNFFNVYIWTRLGAFLGVFSFFLIGRWRNAITASIRKFKKPDRENQSSGLLFLLTRSAGGTGSFLKEKATSLAAASVTIVNALVSAEYIFVYILGIAFSLWLPNIFEEKKDWKSTAQKILAIFLITAGIILVSKNK